MTQKRTPRTSQPQSPVGIDWGNPITKGLVFAWEASLGKDMVSGVLHNRGATVQKSVGRNGVQLGISGASGASNFGSSPTFSNGATETTAMLDIYFASGSPSEKPFGQWDGNNHWLIELDAGNLIWVAAQDSGAARRRWDATGFITAPGWYRIILVWRGGASAAAFVNGVDVSASLFVVNNTAMEIDSTSQILSIGQTGPMTDIIGGFISGAKFWRRGLSDAEIKSLSANPWQLFKPSAKPIFVSASVIVSTPVLDTVGRPATDTTPGAWTPSTGGSLSAMLDEVAADDGDYISVAALSTCELLLNNTAFPGGATQVLSYRAKSTSGNGLTVTLKQGATTIASWSHSLTSTITTYTQTLTAPQIASIVAGPISVTLTST